MFDYKRIFSLASDILAIPSPSGYTKDVIDFLVYYKKNISFILPTPFLFYVNNIIKK